MASQSKTKRGRPTKAGPKPEQLTIRLPPELKYGLDLLARAQHRSMSQALEWALQVGLRNFNVGSKFDPEGQSLGSVVEAVWEEEPGPARLVELYWRAPALMDFEDRAVCELVCTSKQWRAVRPSPQGLKELMAQGMTEDEARQEFKHREAKYWDSVYAKWDILREVAVGRANKGMSLVRLDIAPLLGADKKVEERMKVLK